MNSKPEPFQDSLESAKESKNVFSKDEDAESGYEYGMYVDWLSSLIFTHKNGEEYVGACIPVTYEVWQTL